VKKRQKLISVFLVLILLVSAFPIAVFAADGDLSRFKKGSGYIALGDSYTRGMGASSKWKDELYLMDGADGAAVLNFEGEEIKASKNCRNVTGSFSKILADTIGCYAPDDITDKTAQYWPIAQNGVTTAAIVDLIGLDDDYFDDEYIHKMKMCRSRYAANLEYFGNENSTNEDNTGTYQKTGSVYDIRELIKDASLITIELGMSDVLNRAGSILLGKYFPDGLNLSDLSVIPKAVSTLSAEVWEGYRNWLAAYPLLLEYIKENAPDAEVVIIGAANPLFNVCITDEIAVPIGNIVSTITELMNKQFKRWAKEYGYIFVDISNVELGALENNVSLTELVFDSPDTHPTEKGYKQIARMIIAALSEKSEDAKKTDIVVDLGRFDHIDSVYINGIAVPQKDYELNGYVLTVHCKTALAANMAIAVKNDSGTEIISYKLSHCSCSGYTATRVLVSNCSCKCIMK